MMATALTWLSRVSWGLFALFAAFMCFATPRSVVVINPLTMDVDSAGVIGMSGREILLRFTQENPKCLILVNTPQYLWIIAIALSLIASALGATARFLDRRQSRRALDRWRAQTEAFGISAGESPPPLADRMPMDPHGT